MKCRTVGSMIVLWTLVIGPATSCDSAHDPTDPTIVRLKNPAGSTLHFDVPYTYGGARKIRIDRISTTCGCTDVTLSDSTLSPGARTVMSYTIAGKQRSGQHDYVVALISGTRVVDTIVVRVDVAFSIEPVDVPRIAVLAPHASTSVWSDSVVFRNNESRPVPLTVVARLTDRQDTILRAILSPESQDTFALRFSGSTDELSGAVVVYIPHGFEALTSETHLFLPRD